MSDLIKRSDAINAVREYAEEYTFNSYHKGMLKAVSIIADLPTADRPQGYWTKTDIATYRCSECGKKQIADDINELNFCCCCGSRNKVRRKGADDE